MNAPQFGPAVNGTATPATHSSLFNFLAAGSTNSAIPNFKTIAASFFAAPTTTVAAPVETTPTSGAKSVGPFLPRKHENDKEKNAPGSEPATFLPAIPVYPFPTLTPQAPKHAEPMTVSQPAQTEAGSTAPVSILPAANQAQDLARIFTSQSTTRVPAKILSLHQDLMASDVEPTMPEIPNVQLNNVASADADDKTGSVVKPDAKLMSSLPTTEVPSVAKTVDETPSKTSPSSLVAADKAPLHQKKNVDVIETTSESTKAELRSQAQTFLKATPKAGETSLHAEIAPRLANTPPVKKTEPTAPSVVLNNVLNTDLNTTKIDTHLTNATGFGQKLSSKIEKPTLSIENKKFDQPKQSTATANDGAADNTQESSAVEPEQTLQQPVPAPQSIDDAIKAVIPQAVAFQHSVSGSTLGHLTNLHPTQSVKSESKSNQEEPVEASAAPAISDMSSVQAPSVTKATPPVELNSKASNGKGKTDIAVKKTQRTDAENQSDATTVTNLSHRTETNAVVATQSTTSKNHDTITPPPTVAPHAKSATTKNAPENSDLASSSTTQVPEIDDIAPPSHTGVSTAKLVQGLTQSELRVGLQTRDFGNIDIRTSASRHEFSAQISVEHSEVAHTLSSELPNLYARLNEQQVPVTNIHIHNQSLTTSSGLDQRSQQSSSQQSQSSVFTKQQSEPTLPLVHEVFSSTDRLDIRV